ncbi:MAG: MFS transporter [Pseudomonadales bacterium]|nr:MFS transporter [Pseudomonadales bacterium]
MLIRFDGRLSALRHPQYLRYWLGSFASVGATQLQVMGQGWLLYELTGSALMLGYLGAAASVPAIVMTLFGGVLADRLDKKRVLMTTSLVVAVLLALLAGLDFTEAVSPWHVIAIAGVISFVSGFDWPTRQALFPYLIERDDMMSAVALNSIIWQSCRMVMPALGGLVIAFADTWVVFALCAAGFFTMFIVIGTLSVSLPAIKSALSTVGQIAEGLGFILGNRLFLVLISLSYAGMFFGTAHMQLMPAFSKLLGAGETGYGYLISATGVGSVIGTIVVGAFQDSRRLGHIILGAAALSGASVYCFCAASSLLNHLDAGYYVALATVFMASMFSSIFMICSMTVLQLKVPDGLRGRVMGFHGITYSLMPLGGLLAGTIAALTSTPTAIAISISFYLLIIAGVTVTQRDIRRIDGGNIEPAAAG